MRLKTIAFFSRVCHSRKVRHTRASAYTHVLPFSIVFVTRASAYTHILPFSLVFVTHAKYAFGLLGGNVQKPYLVKLTFFILIDCKQFTFSVVKAIQ